MRIEDFKALCARERTEAPGRPGNGVVSGLAPDMIYIFFELLIAPLALVNPRAQEPTDGTRPRREASRLRFYRHLVLPNRLYQASSSVRDGCLLRRSVDK